MKEIKSFYKTIFGCFAVFCLCWFTAVIVGNVRMSHEQQVSGIKDTDFGAFLATQHALYVNDFATASAMMKNVHSDLDIVKGCKGIAEFFGGNIPENVDSMKDDKELITRMIYDAYLIQKNDWKSLYQRHNKENSIVFAPLRIFSSVKQGKTKEALNFIDSLKTNKSRKAFLRGQIALLNNDKDKAAKEFAEVHPDFMNVNDYLYLMSFYKENGMTEDMDILRNDFGANPDGMFVLTWQDIPDWSNYSGLKNNLVFSIVQTVAHTHIMFFTDLSLMLLRFAESISDGAEKNAINYYLGQYYIYNSGDYEKSFNKIPKNHPLYLFGRMKIAEKTGDFKEIEKIAYKNPLFINASKAVIIENIKKGRESDALLVIHRALRHKDLTNMGRAYFLKQRANVYLMFNRPKRAQKDLDEVLKLDDRMLSDVLLLQARIWAQQDKNLEEAYDYAMTVVKRNTSDVVAWGIVGVLVDKREGIDEALSLMERVGEISYGTKSSLYEHLGDLYMKKGYKEKAKKAYSHALDLSGDGLVVIPFVEKKLRKLK